MNKKIITFILFLTLLTPFIINMQIVKAGTNNAINDGDYYFAYGDSITSGKQTTVGCINVWEDAFMYRMVELYDAVHTEDHVSYDAGGNRFSWPNGFAWDSGDPDHYFYQWLNWNNYYFIISGGGNDCSYWYGQSSHPADDDFKPANFTTGVLRMINETYENDTIPIFCMPTGGQQNVQVVDYPGWQYENYCPWYNTTMVILKNYSVHYVPFFDAIDLDPWNGRLDNTDDTYWSCASSVAHIGQLGHDACAEMLWYFINGWDYNVTYWDTNNTGLVEADYNETIYINNTYWNSLTVQVTYQSNGTIVPHILQDNFFGYEQIRFDIIKGTNYLIKDGSSTYGNFTDICGLTNNSDIGDYSGVVWGNITYPSGYDLTKNGIDGEVVSVDYYRVRICNDSTFVDPFLSENNLDQWFNLSGGAVAVPFIGTHYYQAGVRVKVVSPDGVAI